MEWIIFIQSYKISQDLENVFTNSGEVLCDNFVGVFHSYKKQEFLQGQLKENLKSKKARYPFMVANTDPEKKPGTHWWSFLDTDAKDTLFFSDSFGCLEPLSFIAENDLDIFNKIIPGKFNQIFKQDQKITLLRWTFKHKNYKKLTSVEINKLSDTAKNLFAFLEQFDEYKRIGNNVKVVTVDDNLQSFQTNYCEIFQMYFYLYLFKIFDHC